MRCVADRASVCDQGCISNGGSPDAAALRDVDNGTSPLGLPL